MAADKIVEFVNTLVPFFPQPGFPDESIERLWWVGMIRVFNDYSEADLQAAALHILRTKPAGPFPVPSEILSALAEIARVNESLFRSE